MSFRAPEGNTRDEPITTAIAMRAGVLTLDADGRWTIGATGTPDGFVTHDADGRATADETALAHDRTVRVTATRGTIYDA